MATLKPKTVPFHREKERKTNYLKRLKLLLSKKKRMVLRFSNTKITAQLVEFTPAGDKVLVAVDSFVLKKSGWKFSCKNVPAAYLTGLAFGKKALKERHQEAIFDTGAKAPLHKGKAYAFLKGALDAGLTIPHGADKEIFPNDESLTGKHIQEDLEKVKKEGSGKRFTQYLKSDGEHKKITDAFEQVKKKIMGN